MAFCDVGNSKEFANRKPAESMPVLVDLVESDIIHVYLELSQLQPLLICAPGLSAVCFEERTGKLYTLASLVVPRWKLVPPPPWSSFNDQGQNSSVAWGSTYVITSPDL